MFFTRNVFFRITLSKSWSFDTVCLHTFKCSSPKKIFKRNNTNEHKIMTLKSFSQQDEEERAFSEAMVDVMENLSSIADFIPALDFLARRGRKMVVSNCRNVEDYAKRVCSLLFLLLLSLLPFLSTFPFLLTNVSGDQKERDGAAFGAS